MANRSKQSPKGIIFIKKHHKDSTCIYYGTLAGLVSEVFSYTLECGHFWKPSISMEPKSLKSLVRAVNNSYDVLNRYSDYVEESNFQEFLQAYGSDFDRGILTAKAAVDPMFHDRIIIK